MTKKHSLFAVFIFSTLLGSSALIAQAAELYNLIENPSFETVATSSDPAGWSRGGYGANTRIFTYPTAGIDGVNAAKVEITSYTSGDAKWYFGDVAVTGGKVHTLQHLYRSNVPTKLYARYQTGGEYVYQFLATFPATEGWAGDTRSIVIPPGATALTIFHVIDRVGSLEIDGFILTPGSPAPVEVAGNLISNPTFAIINPNGNPRGWRHGSYGNNTPHHAVYPCRYYSQSELPYSMEDIRFGFAFRPSCPPDTLYALTTSVSDYVDGDAKWYFNDVSIGADKTFTLSYQFQAYNHRSRAIARYNLGHGVYHYALLGEMIPPTAGGQGYVGWKNASHEFTAPDEAKSLTVFFAVGPDGVCDTPCTDSDRGGTLSIANVALTQR